MSLGNVSSLNLLDNFIIHSSVGSRIKLLKGIVEFTNPETSVWSQQKIITLKNPIDIHHTFVHLSIAYANYLGEYYDYNLMGDLISSTELRIRWYTKRLNREQNSAIGAYVNVLWQLIIFENPSDVPEIIFCMEPQDITISSTAQYSPPFCCKVLVSAEYQWQYKNFAGKTEWTDSAKTNPFCNSTIWTSNGYGDGELIRCKVTKDELTAYSNVATITVR